MDCGRPNPCPELSTLTSVNFRSCDFDLLSKGGPQDPRLARF